MSIRLCQECCQWVWTRAGRCPDCQDALQETNRPEDLTARFQTLLGRVHGRIGHVQIPRRRLPTSGVLYETEHGLFFLPHRTVTRMRLVESSSTSPFWTLAATIWAPLMIVLPFLKKPGLSEQTFQESEPVRLNNDDLHLLPELLGRHPGTLFIPLRSMQSVHVRRKRWIIERTRGTRLTIHPAESITFAQRMDQILESDRWRFLAGQS